MSELKETSSINEVISRIINHLMLNKYKVAGIVNMDILLQLNDGELSVSYNMVSEMFHIYQNGYQTEYLSKYNVENNLTPIDKNLYKKMIDHILYVVERDTDCTYELQTQLKILEDREDYETASKIYNILTRMKGVKYLW